MALDYGLSARERARLRAARRRAGLKPKPSGRIEDRRKKKPRVEPLPIRTALDRLTPDIEDTRDYGPKIPEKGAYQKKDPPKKPKAAAKRKTPAEARKLRGSLDRVSQGYGSAWEPVVRGESAAEKARVGPQQRARESFEALQMGKLPPAQFAKQVASLTMGEKRDLESYSRVRSRQVQKEAFGKLKRDTGRFLDEAVGAVAGVKPSEAFWSFTNPIERLTSPDQSPGAAMPWGPVRGGRAFKAGGVQTPTLRTVQEAARPAGAEKVIEALPEAKRLRREQEKLYSAERSKRAGQAERAMQEGGQAGYRAALAELQGELPKLKFGALENFDQQAADALFTHVQKHPEFRPFEKVRTQTALKKVLDGAVPTKSEIKLLDKAFGPDVASQITDSIGFWQKAKTAGYDIINVPRAIKSSFDLSAPFRQGLVLGARHPRMFASEFKPMVKAMKSPRAYEDVMDEIAARPTFKTMQDAKLQLTDLMGLSTREEGFMSNFAEKIPGVGIGVRGSGRAYVAFLNKFRADAFDNYLTMADTQGLDIQDPALLKSIASWVNTATGRGSVKSLEGAMVPLNAAFFSPRLIASRLQLLNPAYYAKLDPFARKQAVQGMAQLAGGISLTLWMAKMAGAEVGVDPRSADFGKIKVGDTRVDVAGGLQQYIVAASRIIKGESVSSTTGEVTRLEGGFAKPSRWSLAGDFFENKASPVAGYGIDFAKNENFAGDPFDPAKETGRLFLPLGAENAYEGFKASPGTGAASVGLGGIGFGVQTYATDPVKVKQAKERAALRRRGPEHVRRHEDDMATLRAAASQHGTTVRPEATAASRAIRNLDMRLTRVEKKKGDTLTKQERMDVLKPIYFAQYPARKNTWAARFERAAGDEERLYSYYLKMRAELRKPLKRELDRAQAS